MVAALDRTIHRLVVTGPERDRLYDHFRRLFYGRDDVTIVKDRRLRERRVRRLASGDERRSTERRDGPPVWIVPPD
jgi:hypothetical protein